MCSLDASQNDKRHPETQDMRIGARSKEVLRKSPTDAKPSEPHKLPKDLQHWFIPSSSARILSSYISTKVVN